MTKNTERLVAFGFGVVFVVVLLVLAIAFPTPTPFQYTVFRVVLALAAGGVAAMIPGFVTVSLSTWLRAGGALAVFIIVYFYSPAALTGVTVKTEQEQEIEKPIVEWRTPRQPQPWLAVPVLLAAAEQQREALPLLVLNDPNGLTAEVLKQRYKVVRVDGARVQVPRGSAIVANEIEGAHSGALVGEDFSVVARRLANLTVDVSGASDGKTAAGSVRLYVKVLENARILAKGVDGLAGASGKPGKDGANGSNGRDGSCDGFGGYRGADAGRPGEDGGDGENGQAGADGQAGGFAAITTVVNPISTTVDVSGGQGGIGGQGGAAGAAGRGGTGGRGCTGLGGSQPNQGDGASGKAGKPGSAGSSGRAGAAGEYRLQIVKTFDAIVGLLNQTPNDALHHRLASTH